MYPRTSNPRLSKLTRHIFKKKKCFHLKLIPHLIYRKKKGVGEKGISKEKFIYLIFLKNPENIGHFHFLSMTALKSKKI